jgi:putative flavoprotein involved in K+ transport
MTAGPSGSLRDVLVIGGGQAGLTMGYYLAQRGLRFQIVDAGAEVGAVWRSRWDSLRLFTPAQYDNLPGLPFPASANTYPGKDDVASYLQAYAAKFELPVRPDTMVTSLTRSNGVYVAKAGGEALEARQVVVATGPFQVPFIPPIAKELDPGVCQLHSVEYRHSATMPPGRVLVVGAANSGCQIARELSATHAVELSVGQRLPAIPQRPLGRDVWWWASMLGLDRVTAGSRLGRRLAGRDQVIGPGPRRLARRHGIPIRPRAASTAGRTITFTDGSAAKYDTVVWATGFRTDHTWIDIPGVTDKQGRILHTRGVTPSPGLYMLGHTWQHTRTSALLGWVRNDAAFLDERIAARTDEEADPGPAARTSAASLGVQAAG